MKRTTKKTRCFRAMLVLYACVGASTALGAIAWDPYNPLHEEIALPQTYWFTAYRGEQINFVLSVTDVDRTQDTCGPGGQPINYPSGTPYIEQEWTISGRASFSSSGSVKTHHVYNGYSGNVRVYIGADFADGYAISVSVTASDHGRILHYPEDLGTDKDEGTISKSWTITFKTICPTNVSCYSPAPDPTAWQVDPVTYWYQCLPDSPYVPEYNHSSIQESFGSPTSNLDKNVHITAAGRAMYPSWTNNQWRDYLFPTGMNASVVPDSQDRFGDAHAGFAENAGFLVSPLTANLYWQLPETYSCISASTTLSKSYTIRRQHNAGETVGSPCHIRKW